MIKIITEFLAYYARSILAAYRFARFSACFPSIRIDMPSKIQVDELSAIRAGEHIHIGIFSELVVLEASPYSLVPGSLSLGNRVVIGSGANIRAAGGSITLGDNVLIAQNVSLIAANHSLDRNSVFRDAAWDEQRTGICIAENVWLGSNSIVLPGTSIGKNSVIAAGAVVSGQIPSDEIWGGIPARRLRKL